MQFSRLRSLLLLPPLILAASDVGALGADLRERTLTVTVDHESLRAGELVLLEDQVREAVSSRPRRIFVSSAESGVRATVLDPDLDKAFLEALNARFASPSEYSVSKSSALSICISYSVGAQKQFGAERLARDADTLEEIVRGLRQLPPGVEVEPEDGGAIVRARDPSFGTMIANAFHGSIIITPFLKHNGMWHQVPACGPGGHPPRD